VAAKSEEPAESKDPSSHHDAVSKWWKKPLLWVGSIVTVLVAAIATVIGTNIGHWISPTKPPPAAVRPADGADPKQSNCQPDAKDVTTVRVVGSSSARHIYGYLKVRYSPQCRGAWPQFVTTRRVPTGVVIHLITHRPHDNATTEFDWTYTVIHTVYTIYGNLLQTGKGCVSVTVDVRNASNKISLARATTPCVSPR